MVMVHAWEGERVLSATVMKNGALVGWGRYELSADGRSLTVVTNRMRILFERVG